MGHLVVWCVEEHFPPERASVREARDFVVRALVQHGMSYVVDDTRMVVSELVTNAVVHAQAIFAIRPASSWIETQTAGGREPLHASM